MTGLGGSAGNGKLREALGWDEATYDSAKQALIAEGVIASGRGRGRLGLVGGRGPTQAPGEKVGPGDLARALDLIRSGQDIDYEGVAGSQNFDENGDVLNTIEIWKIENGEITSTGRFEIP